MALSIASFRKTVASAGTAEPLVASKLLAVSFTIRALDGNTGKIFIGSSTSCDSTNGMWLNAGEANEKSPRTTKYGIHQHWDLANVYIDSEVNGEGVVVEYEVDDV
jgi:hypothetical protein